MMRAAILALCLVGVLIADDKFVDHPFEVLIDSTKPGTDTMSITYSINKPASFKPGNPVFYGTGGRVSIEDLKSQYDLFNSVIPDFDNATVVFVEQRYFGNSQSSKAIKTVADLAQLKLDNVVADHVALIKKLSADLKTRNFMIFGGGHGGLIAGYLTKHFNDGKDKTVTGFNVMGWSSSPPIKYVRRQNVDTSIAIAHQIGPQFSAVLKGAVSTCQPGRLQNLFQKLKDTATDAAFLGALWLAPTPAVNGATDASDDTKELSIFIRNQLLGLTFADGLPYIPATNQLDPERILKVLCDKINALDTAAHTTTDNINALLGVLGASATSKLRWKVTDDGFGKINRDLVWQAYQDCTEYQIAYCQPADPGTGDDPFSGSSWVSGVCDTTIKLGATIQAGCTGIFRSLLPADKANFDVSGTQLNKDTYPVALGGFRVLTTINPMSVFGTEPTTQGFGDTDKGKYASFLKVGFTDNWEFRQPRGCDGDTTKKVRYMALRAFGCLGNFITDKAGKKDICKDPTKLFDIATTADPTTFPGTCAVDGSKFPFGQDELKFVDPYYKPPTPTALASTQAQTTVSTTTKGGAGFIPSMMIVLTSGLLVWFTGL